MSTAQIVAKASRLLPPEFKVFAQWYSLHDDCIVMRVRKGGLHVDMKVVPGDEEMSDAMFSERFIAPTISAFERYKS